MSWFRAFLPFISWYHPSWLPVLGTGDKANKKTKYVGHYNGDLKLSYGVRLVWFKHCGPPLSWFMVRPYHCIIIQRIGYNSKLNFGKYVESIYLGVIFRKSISWCVCCFDGFHSFQSLQFFLYKWVFSCFRWRFEFKPFLQQLEQGHFLSLCLDFEDMWLRPFGWYTRNRNYKTIFKL